MAVELIRRGLPKPWSFAVTRDGRIFFVNDEARTTTWLHPVTGEPVCTGNVTLPDLPAGWERSVNSDGVPFYVDHNRKETTFVHPLTQVSSVQYATPKSVSHQPYFTSSPENSSLLYNTSGELRKSQKKKGQNIRSPVIKRDSHSTVAMEGWLYKLEGGALKQWRKRWLVLADFCLFVYKGPDEEKVLASILLPSYKINPCTSEDKISKKFAFKAEHHNMKTYYFAADSKEGMAQWMNVMSLASIMQKSLSPSVNPKITSSNDDEDSGFTSYKSRRYGSTQDPNSTLNSSFGSEQLNFQYCSQEGSRDNFSESSRITGKSSENEFLGSGDKYPGHYGSSLSRGYSASPREQEIPPKGRQPLYANAPPKPKRSGQKDPYAIAPNERYDSARLDYAEEPYEEKSHKHIPKVTSHQNYGTSCPRLYNEQYSYPEQNKKYFDTEHHSKLGSDYMQRSKHVYNDSYYARNEYRQSPGYKEPNLVRPHSADFLEHDAYNDPFSAPVTYRHKSSSRSKTNQPQRPKSSLERYDPCRYGGDDMWAQEDKGYWQRDQVASPMPMHHQGEHCLQEQSIGYYSSQNIPSDEQHYKVSAHEQYCRNSDIPADYHHHHHKQHISAMNDSQNSKSNRIRDRPASAGCHLEESPAAAENLDDPKSQQRELSMKRLLEWKQRMLQSPLARKYPQRASGGQYEDNSVPPPRPPLPEEYQQRVLQELENHEAQVRLRETQYRERSFSDNIPSSSSNTAEVHPDKKQQKQVNYENDLVKREQFATKIESEKTPRTARSPLKSQDHRRPSSSLGHLNDNYSSDEEEDNKKDCKRTRRQSQSSRTRRSSIERTSASRNFSAQTNTSPSPDYVNITMLNDNVARAGPVDSYAGSGKMKSIPAEEDLTNLVASKENLKNEAYNTKAQHLNTTKHYGSPDSVDTSFASNEGEDDNQKEEFYIRKEDYYKASQLFYATPQNKKAAKSPGKNIESSPHQGNSSTSESAKNKTDYKPSKSSCKLQKSEEETYDSRYWRNSEKHSRPHWELDKDVGLPLPPYPNSARMKDARQKKMQLRGNSLPSLQQQKLPEEKPESTSKPKKLSLDSSSSRQLANLSSTKNLEDKTKPCNVELSSPPPKSCSFEEMRTLLQRQKEAPPPNIVQSRIKHFEKTSPPIHTSSERKNSPSNDKQKKDLDSKTFTSKFEMHISSEGAVHQNSSEIAIEGLASLPYRQLCSDSEAVFNDDSTNGNESNDDILTTKSDPIILSPLSSVLADLRRTADTGRDKTRKEDSKIDEVIITKGALRLSMVDGQTVSALDEPHKVEEEAYLPMNGKSSEEAVYVAMNDSKENSLTGHQVNKGQAEKCLEDEPLYNEPISPPPSFLHDVYGKHKTRHSHFNFESSSSGRSSSENIYERPNYFDGDITINTNVKSFVSAAPEENDSSYVKLRKEQNSVCEVKNDSLDKREQHFPSNVTYTAGSHISDKTLGPEEFIDCDIPSQLNDSIPDLLQVKDSDASDADDEASRDFDTPKNLSLPPYQTAILLGEQSSLDEPTSTDDDHNLQNLFPFKSFNPPQSLRTSELSNISSNGSLKKESEVKNNNVEQNSSFEESISSNYRALNEEERFTEFLHDMIPPKAKLPYHSRNYSPAKETDSNQYRTLDENKKLGRKTSLPVIINRKVIEGNLGNTEKLRDFPSMKKLSKVSKSENEMQKVGLSANTEVASTVPKTIAANEAKIVTLSDAKLDHTANSTSYSSLTPDVVPADDREEMSLNTKSPLKTNRSPNSAPYYYSDLLTEADSAKFGRLPIADKFGIQRSNYNLLNNVRDVSPSSSNKSDVGRKVNKITENNKSMIPNRLSSPEPQQNSSSDIARIAEQDLRSSIQHLLIPESTKFRDAEKNKYEAGHTLEKTRTTASTLQRLKKRAATPDFSRSHEHHYENLDSPWAVTVKRLSRSLEELLDTDEGIQNRSYWHSHQFSLPNNNEEPFYENVGFSRGENDNSFDETMKDRDLVASPQTAPAKHTVFENNQLDYSGNISTTDAFSTTKNTESKQELTDSKNTLVHSYSDDHDSDGYLDQNILRSASKKHFLARFSNEKYNSQLKRSQTASENAVSSMGADYFLAEGRTPNYDGGGDVDRGREKKLDQVDLISSEGSSFYQQRNYKPTERHMAKGQNSLGKNNAREQEFFDTSSDSSASFHPENEGNIHQKKHYNLANQQDNPSKNNLGVFRTSKEAPNMSDSEIHVRTPSRLKKLVHQSEGLTSRGKRLSISAGDLLGKTHEELVLLLIQLRRNQSCIAKKKQQCQIQLESEKYLCERESSREERLKKCEEIRHQLLELEKQYEMTQPLINLVDNMVKLGSLYGPERKTTSNSHLETASESISLPCMQLLELSRQLHNRQLSCKGGSMGKDFSEGSLEERLQQLYHLDRTLHDEFLNFSSLQQDREILETTLEGVRKKVSEFRDNAVDMGRLYKQQRMIEKELSKVIRLLMQSIQKLDHIIGENSTLEQEIVCLKQQIQQFLQCDIDVESTPQEKAEIEAELSRVEQIIEELASHRRNINNTIEKVKADSKHKVLASEVRASPTGVAGSVPLPIRKKHQSSYMETDLDTMECRDLSGHGIPAAEVDGNDIPLYANAEEISSPTQEYGQDGTVSSTSTHLVTEDDYNPQDINEADDRMKMFYGIIPKDKPSEIKTVRIVKRESERRNRVKDKKKVTYDDNSLVWVVEEPEIFLYEEDEVEEEVERLRRTLFLPSLYNRPTSLFTPQQEMALSAHERLFGSSSALTNIEDGKLTGDKDAANGSPTRRPKRRHYTISGFSYNPLFKGGLRSCDDVDMERCLRTANTPDIVRSTIKKADVFDDKIIDRELGLPQKINIPERYIENEPEQLSATERLKRSLKAETIRRMLSETTTYEDVSDKQEPSDMLKKKVDEEKKRRARLLALNHALAREVMERSKIVAANVSSSESPYSLP